MKKVTNVVLMLYFLCMGTVLAQESSDASKIKILKVVINLEDVVDKTKQLDDGSLMFSVYWIPEEYGSPLGNRYRTLATEKEQLTFLSQLKSTNYHINFEKIRQHFTKVLVDSLKSAGLYQEISNAMTINIILKILPGPWDLGDPFASDKRKGVLFYPTATINYDDGRSFRKLDIDGTIIEWEWLKVKKTIEIISESLVQTIKEE